MNPLRVNSIQHATNDVQDCLIVGGGINGAVAAAALAGKGARITIIDRGDFASCTSQESSNLAWGGIKYLEDYQFSLVWKLCKSRNILQKSYPSQIQEIRFLAIIAKGFRKPRFLVYLGTLLYWLMGRFRLKNPRLYSVDQIKKRTLPIQTDHIQGAVEYSDCYLVENDARFTFSFIQKVLQNEGNAINYMELRAAFRDQQHWNCTLYDHLNDKTYQVRSKSLINAAGPYADALNAMLRQESPFKHLFSKGTHILIPRITKLKEVLTFFASDGRLFFMIPMKDRTCIGTTDIPLPTPEASPDEDEIIFLLDNANKLLQLDKPIMRADIISYRCGVRPLVVHKTDTQEDKPWTSISRKHELWRESDKKFACIYGGKLTDCINVGEEVIELMKSFGIHLFSRLTPWYGELSLTQKQSFMKQGKALKLSTVQLERLWRRYDKNALQCLKKIQQDPTMSVILIDSYMRAEIHVMKEFEMIMNLDDFFRRRTSLSLRLHRATLRCHPALPEISKILFVGDAQIQIDKYFNHLPR